MALQHEPKRRATLEICVDSIVSARNAQEAGADRVELCVSLIEGGITPSFGLIEATVRALRIPVYVLIRPRAGDFFYSDEEIECMLRDVEACSDLGAKGIVVGFLTASGSIDERLTGIFLERARKCKMDFTFHRAFDMVNDPTEGVSPFHDAAPLARAELVLVCSIASASTIRCTPFAYVRLCGRRSEGFGYDSHVM